MNNSLIAVNFLGLDYRHDRDFLINRPSGSGDYLFLHFTTPIEIRDGSGTKQHKGNSCILYSPGHPQWYRNIKTGFVNHWIHFSVTDPGLLFKHVPLNRVFHPWHVNFILRDLAAMRDELFRKEIHWQEFMDLHVRRFLLDLSRATTPVQGTRMTKHQQVIYRKMLDLKARIGRDYNKKWTISGMASRIPISPSRFSALYKEFFKVSPVEDLLSIRIGKARWMLESMPYSIARIGEECGFENIQYFSRLFKLRTGCSPSRYCSLRRTGKTRKNHLL